MMCGTKNGLAIGLVALTGLALAGCDRKDATLDALGATAVKLRAAGGAGEASRKTFSEVTTSVAEIARNGERSGTSASLMIAVSQLGLSDAELQKYLASEAQSLSLADQVRSALSQYLSMHEAAKGADAFSIAGEMGRINTERAKDREALEHAKAEKSNVEKEITTLTGDSKARLEAAHAKLVDAAKLTENLAKLSAADGAVALQQAYDIKVKAESDRKAGLELQAKADMLQPVMDEWTLKITQYENLLQNLTDSEKSLQDQERLAKQTAADARTDAGKAGDRVADLVRQMQELRSGPLDEAATKALATLKKAIDATREMSKPAGNPGQAALLAGTAQQAIGEIQWSRSSGAGAYAMTLKALAETKPALPASADYAAKADAATKAQTETSDAAKAAFEEAQRGFEKAASANNGPGAAAAREQLKALATRYKKLAGKAGDTAADAAAAAPAEPAPAPAAAAPAGGSYDPDLRKALEADIAAAKGMKNLDDAMKAKYGKTMEELAASMPGGGQMMGGMQQSKDAAAALAAVTVEALQVTVNGDSATIAIPGSTSLTAKKIGGAWVVVQPGMEAMLSQPAMASQVGAMQTVLSSIGKIADELAGEIKAGKHATPDDAMKAFMGKMMQAMQGMGGG